MTYSGTTCRFSESSLQLGVKAQQAALGAMRAGVLAEEVAAAAIEVYRAHGFLPSYRTGCSIGVAYLQAPELKEGDKTALRPSMTLTVHGGVTVKENAAAGSATLWSSLKQASSI